MSNFFKFGFSVLYLILLVFPAHADEKDDHYARLKKGWNDIQVVYEQINKHYVEDIDPYLLIKAGIEGMLKKLDPYTVFLEEDGDRRLKMITTGKYGGLGIEIGLRNKKITVITPIDDSPAKRAGIRAGDIIEKVGNTTVDGWNVNKVSKNLRGKIGTEVTITIRRPGIAEPFEVTLTRAEIVLKDISYTGFVDEGAAYLALSGFTDKAPTEVRNAINKLQKQSTIKSFILDLRGNPGGLLSSAVEIVNIFVDPGELVLSTKGFREKEYTFFTRNQALLPDVPLVVLVNNGSASASEIVAGAMQDLDRAVIIGEATFGKGLVQKVYTVDQKRDVKLKMTTAKYYIPSGRCIQKKDYSNGNSVIVHDSLQTADFRKKEFFTKHKRIVFDKGGIEPDIVVKHDSLSAFMTEVIRKNLLFDFAVAYHQKHPRQDITLVADDSLTAVFEQFLSQRNFKYRSLLQNELAKMKKVIATEALSEKALELLNKLEARIEEEQQNSFIKNRPEIEKYLLLELAEKYYGKKEKYRLGLKKDPALLKAVEVLKNSEIYKNILAIN